MGREDGGASHGLDRRAAAGPAILRNKRPGEGAHPVFSITQEESETTEEREQFGVERDWLDAKGVVNKYADKPGVAKQVFDNCPPVSQSGIVFRCGAYFRVLGVCCC